MISFNFKKVLKNFYFLFFIFFLIWMLFIDSNGIRNRYYLNKKTNELSDEIDYYKKEINNLELERKAFDKNDKLLEKYARENYMMKKKTVLWCCSSCCIAETQLTIISAKHKTKLFSFWSKQKFWC